jgi:hypothetical protein
LAEKGFKLVTACSSGANGLANSLNSQGTGSQVRVFKHFQMSFGKNACMNFYFCQGSLAFFKYQLCSFSLW